MSGQFRPLADRARPEDARHIAGQGHLLGPGKPLADGSPGPGLYCAVIIKRVDERTRSKTAITELLRD